MLLLLYSWVILLGGFFPFPQGILWIKTSFFPFPCISSSLLISTPQMLPGLGKGQPIKGESLPSGGRTAKGHKDFIYWFDCW